MKAIVFEPEPASAPYAPDGVSARARS